MTKRELKAEVERLRAELGIDAAGTTRADRLARLIVAYRRDLFRTEDRLERMALIARRRGYAAKVGDAT